MGWQEEHQHYDDHSANVLLDGTNSVNIFSDTDLTDASSSEDRHYLNRIALSYPRQFVAMDDALVFGHDGQSEFTVTNFSDGTPANVLVWDVTDRMAPTALTSGSIAIGGGGNDWSYTFVADSAGAKQYAVANAAGLMTPAALSTYTAPNIDPAAGADWIAITHADFITAANTLAAHRATPLYGGLSTLVVDVQDVYNQYGYGYPMPESISGLPRACHDAFERLGHCAGLRRAAW